MTDQSMLASLKRILLQQYIGAIVTALIAAQAVTGLLRLVMIPVGYFVLNASSDSNAGMRRFDRGRFVVALVELCLQFAVVFGLVRWLFYGSTEPEQNEHSADA
jgi:hypothetical protein